VTRERVAVLTDVHGNLPALEAALASVEGHGVDELLCGGDLVGDGPRPDEVSALVEERAIPTIYGNYDYAIARGLEDCGCAYVTQHDCEVGQLSARARLARKVNEYLFEDKPERTFERIAALADCDMLVFGHTHKTWVHEYGVVVFVNCSSVGKPKDGDPHAAYECSRPRTAQCASRSSASPTTPRPSRGRCGVSVYPTSSPRSS